MTDPEAEVLAEFRERMIGQRSGDASVIDVRFAYSINEYAEEYLRVELVLPDPPSGVAFWPLRDIDELLRRGRAEIRRRRVAPPYVVGFHHLPKPGELADGDGSESHR